MTPPCILFSFVHLQSILFCSSSLFSFLFIITLEIFFRDRHLGPCCPSAEPTPLAGNVWPPVALAVRTCRRAPMLPTAITHLVSQCRGAPRTDQSDTIDQSGTTPLFGTPAHHATAWDSIPPRHYSGGSAMPRRSANKIAPATVSRSACSKRCKAARTDAGGPRSRSSRGGGLTSNMSSILVTRENIT